MLRWSARLVSGRSARRCPRGFLQPALASGFRERGDTPGTVAEEPESFLVTKHNQLEPGEADLAPDWGARPAGMAAPVKHQGEASGKAGRNR